MLRAGLAPWSSSHGFKRLGDRGWIRAHENGHLIVAVQCLQSGWDPRAGSRFVVEFERSAVPKIASSGDRNRIWYLLDELRRQEALNINRAVAQTLPPPDDTFTSTLPPDVREHYLGQFAPSTKTVESSDVWFCYYDETDAQAWADFLSRTIDPALQTFLAQPPSLMGWRPSNRQSDQ